MGHNLSNPAAPADTPAALKAVAKPASDTAAKVPAPTDTAADRAARTRPRSPTVELPMKRRRKHGRSRKPRRDNRKSRFDADYTADDERNNPYFEAYYREQGIVPPEEFDALLETLATPLATSFRITASGKFRESIQERLRGEMCELFQSVKKKGTEEAGGIKPPSPLPWYPEDLAWTVSAPRQMLRRDNVLAPFHKFLVQMNDIGAINRQEAVSMIPPLMLAVEPGQSVIDLCAAPGSKTAQILENASTRGADSEVPTLARDGLVIANDADIRRCWMLSHQLKRFASADLVVTHHDAQFFPKVMMFDRVLCDVPCTGDGTLRKAPDIWRRWTPDMGIGIHRLQRQILERGLDILKPGGRLVYSTCSMNPLEDEAVVAHALRKYGDDIELADVSDMLPGLKRRPGLTSWKVKDNSEKNQGTNENGSSGKEETVAGEDKSDIGERQAGEPGSDKPKGMGGWFTSFDQVPLRRRKKIVHSLFPPSNEEQASGKFPLERCMRLVPHDQDTGAFFVSVFVKKAEAKVHRKLQKLQKQEQDALEAGAAGKGEEAKPEANVGDDAANEEGADVEPIDETSETPEQKDGEGEGRAGGRPTKGRRGTRLITDDPLVSLSFLNPDMLSNITCFYGIDDSIGSTSLMTRGSDAGTFKRVVAVSPKVRWLLRHSLGSRDGEESTTPLKRPLRVVNAGVRILERTDRKDTTCPFRLIHEGLELMREVMTERVGQTENVEAVRRLVTEDAVKLEGIECTRLREALTEMGSGSCVVELVEGLGGMARERLVTWKGRSNVAAVMPREQTAAVRQRLEGTNGKEGYAERRNADLGAPEGDRQAKAEELVGVVGGLEEGVAAREKVKQEEAVTGEAKAEAVAGSTEVKADVNGEG